MEKGTIEGVANYTRVEPTIGCAGAVKPDAMPAIKAQGFASVVNLRMANEPGAEVEASRAAAEKAGLRYIHLPFDGSSPDPAVVEKFLAAVKEPANQPMFIHCASANRVGAVWLIKRVKQDGWPVERALEEATAIGLTNPALKKFALDYVGAAG
ncbi:MAG TPA: protein tyrosine phosphatase family protein [Vicinamibacterales bacterium]